MHILAGDIGGTNTRFRFVAIDKTEPVVVAEKDYSAKNFNALIDVINVFIAEHKLISPIDAVCMAVAGPVKSGVVSVTNLPWVISEAELSQSLDVEHVCLINDFIAVSYGISELGELDFLIMQNRENTSGNKDAAVIGAGTGLGASHLVWRDNHYDTFASEAGHAGFAPETTQQTELLGWLQASSSHISVEDILSGRGLVTIYEFLRETTDICESGEVRQAMEDEDPAKVISEYALLESDELCQVTLDCFVDIYGATAGNIALHYYPLQTVYIAGGIAPKIRHLLYGKRFIRAFTNKGLMSENMKGITIKMVLNDRVGLYGAVSYAHRLFGTSFI